MRRQQGFSAVEVLVAILILGIVGYYAIPSFVNATGRDAKKKQETALKQAVEAAQDFYAGAEHPEGGGSFWALRTYDPDDLPAGKSFCEGATSGCTQVSTSELDEMRTMGSKVNARLRFVFVRRAQPLPGGGTESGLVRGLRTRVDSSTGEEAGLYTIQTSSPTLLDGRTSDGESSADALFPPQEGADPNRILVLRTTESTVVLCNRSAELVLCAKLSADEKKAGADEEISEIQWGASETTAAFADDATCHGSVAKAVLSSDEPCALPDQATVDVTSTRDGITDRERSDLLKAEFLAKNARWFTCELDGQPISNAGGGRCSSPLDFSVSLSPANQATPHSLVVTAHNTRGAAAPKLFVVNSQPPQITIVDRPPATTTTKQGTVTFTVSQGFTPTCRWRKNNGTWNNIVPVAGSPAYSCSTPDQTNGASVDLEIRGEINPAAGFGPVSETVSWSRFIAPDVEFVSSTIDRFVSLTSTANETDKPTNSDSVKFRVSEEAEPECLVERTTDYGVTFGAPTAPTVSGPDGDGNYTCSTTLNWHERARWTISAKVGPQSDSFTFAYRRTHQPTAFEQANINALGSNGRYWPFYDIKVATTSALSLIPLNGPWPTAQLTLGGGQFVLGSGSPSHPASRQPGAYSRVSTPMFFQLPANFLVSTSGKWLNYFHTSHVSSSAGSADPGNVVFCAGTTEADVTNNANCNAGEVRLYRGTPSTNVRLRFSSDGTVRCTSSNLSIPFGSTVSDLRQVTVYNNGSSFTVYLGTHAQWDTVQYNCSNASLNRTWPYVRVSTGSSGYFDDVRAANNPAITLPNP